MHQHGVVIDIHAAPVRAAMALARTLGQRLLAKRTQVGTASDIKNSKDRTHSRERP